MGFLSKLWGYLAGIGVALLALGAALIAARRQGAQDEREAGTERSLKQAKEASEIDSAVHNLSQSVLDRRLRDSQRDKRD